MDIILHILLPISAYLGIVFGIFAVYYNKSEIEPARKYLIFSQKALLSFVILFTAYSYQLCCGTIFIALIIVALLFLARKRIPSAITYPMLGILCFLTIKIETSLITNLAAVFIYGIPAGTLIMSDNKYRLKRAISDIAKNLGFFIFILLVLATGQI